MTASTLRYKYGDAQYVTIIDDNITIPWRVLSLGDFLIYDELIKTGNIADVVLEDEIFKKCVTDIDVLNNLDNLPAGIIGIVAQNIINYSGPSGIDAFNELLEQKRAISANPIHKLAPLVVRAFPSYKLEDVYNLSYDTFMLRLAQAEELLLTLGIIKEGISLMDDTQPVIKKKRTPPPELKAAWERQQKAKEQPKVDKEKKPKKDYPPVKFTEPSKSPIFDGNKLKVYKKSKDIDADRIATEQAVGTEEENALRANMIKQLKFTHKDLLTEFQQKVKK